jgi:hypothetical protein
LQKGIAVAGAKMPILSSNNDKLAASCRDQYFRGDGHSLPGQEYLINI